MAVLEYKRRVRLPEDFFLEKRNLARRPWPRWPLFTGAWLAFTGLCFAITTDRVPVGRWLTDALEPAALAKPPATANANPAAAPAPNRTETPVAAAAAPQLDVAEQSDGAGADDAVPADAVPREAEALDAESFAEEPSAAPATSAPRLAGLESPDESKSATGVEDDGAFEGTVDVPHVASTALPSPPDRAAPKAAAASQSSVGTSCEAAIASYQEEIRIGGAAAPPDLSRAQFASVLENGSYFAHCGVPDAMSVDVCAAVRNGRAVGVSIRTDPGNSAIQACIARAVRGLAFPAHPRMDVTRTRFGAQ
ncbi:MAG: hypothetical protein R3B07_24495 [Polyangiaceae bacterium]